MHPSSTLATRRPDLGGSVEEFDLAADRGGFIGLRVLPVIEAAKDSGTFGVIPVKELLKEPETARAPGSGYHRIEGKFGSDSFKTEEHGAEFPVDDSEAAIYREYFDMEVIATQRCLDAVLRGFEKRIADAVFDSGAFSPTSVSTEWSTASTATPITDVEARADAMWAACGRYPNALIINRKVFRNLRNCAQILDKIKYVNGTLPGEIGLAELQAAFDLPFIIVAGGARNSANEAQDVSIASIWSNEYAGVARIAVSPDIQEPCLGRTIHWAEDGSRIGTTMETYRDENVRSDIVRSRMQTDEKLITSECMQLLSNITA